MMLEVSYAEALKKININIFLISPFYSRKSPKFRKLRKVNSINLLRNIVKNQRRIQNPVEHLRWSFLQKYFILNSINIYQQLF